MPGMGRCWEHDAVLPLRKSPSAREAKSDKQSYAQLANFNDRESFKGEGLGAQGASLNRTWLSVQL